MATQRQQRYRQLLTYGFLPFEAREYSKIPLYGDALRLMVKTRYQDYVSAGKPKLNSVAWLRLIRHEYEVKDWEWNLYVGAWRQYRQYESIWHDRHPGKTDKWQSPTKNNNSRKKYRELNRDRINKQAAKYRATHKDVIRKYAKEYRLRKKNK